MRYLKDVMKFAFAFRIHIQIY